jgi:hypothetical protein
LQIDLKKQKMLKMNVDQTVTKYVEAETTEDEQIETKQTTAEHLQIL